MTPLRGIVTDIEGTTTPVSFVTETLFPYARRRLPGFVRAHAAEPEIAQAIAETCDLAGQPSLGLDGAIERLLAWIDEDRKATPLKTLQGLIWREGYVAGELRGAVYPDVKPALAAWAGAGRRLFVYSSGSVEAQRLLFRHSEAGDLTPYFEDYFDTRTGPKREPGSYTAIARAAGLEPGAMLFLSDTVAELDAAAAAGFVVAALERGLPVSPAHRHPIHRDFTGICPL